MESQCLVVESRRSLRERCLCWPAAIAERSATLDRTRPFRGPRPAIRLSRMAWVAAVRASVRPQILNHCIERRTVDQLHGIVVNAAIFAGGVDRHDIGVVQFAGGFRFTTKTQNSLAAESQPTGKDLQGDFALQGLLPSFVNHPHSAAAEFAQDLEVANLLWQILAFLPPWFHRPSRLCRADCPIDDELRVMLQRVLVVLG